MARSADRPLAGSFALYADPPQPKPDPKPNDPEGTGAGEDGPTKSPGTGGGDSSAGTTCCIVAFQYPVAPPVFKKETTGAKSFLGWEFEVLALWKNSGVDEVTGLKCDCNCCQFRQLREGEEQWIPFEPQTGVTILTEPPAGAADDPKNAPIKKSGEDCTDVTDKAGTRRVCFGKGDPALQYTEGKSSYEYISKGGVAADAPPGVADLVKSALAGSKETIDSVCVYYMKDKPGAYTSGLGRFRKDFCFTGQIWNLCPSEKLAREEKFRLYMSGKIYEERIGDVEEYDAKTGKALPKVKKPILGVWHDAKPKSPQYIPKCLPPK
jgi:hypothetical protein